MAKPAIKKTANAPAPNARFQTDGNVNLVILETPLKILCVGEFGLS